MEKIEVSSKECEAYRYRKSGKEIYKDKHYLKHANDLYQRNINIKVDT